MRADRLSWLTLAALQARGQLRPPTWPRGSRSPWRRRARDLEALSLAAASRSTPSPAAGAAGPWSGARGPTSTGLTAPEAQALFLLAGPASVGQPGPGLGAAQARPRAARAPSGAGRGERRRRPWCSTPASLGRTRARPARSGRGPATRRGEPRRQVELDYRTRGGEQIKRYGRSVGLVDKAGLWYLIAGTTSRQADLPGRPDRDGEADREAGSNARTTSISPTPGGRWSRRSRSSAR